MVTISETPTTHQLSKTKTKLNKVGKKAKTMKRKCMWRHKHTHQTRKQLSDVDIQDLSGNWTQDEPKVPKKAKLIGPKAYQCPSVSHNSKKQL